MIRVSVRIYFRGQINFLLSAGNSSKYAALRSGCSYGHTHYEAFTRAVAPGTDLKPYSVFEVVEPINVKEGKIAPWFDESGGGILRRIK